MLVEVLRVVRFWWIILYNKDIEMGLLFKGMLNIRMFIEINYEDEGFYFCFLFFIILILSCIKVYF